MARIIGRGPVTLGTSTITPWAEYRIETDVNIVEVRDLTTGHTKRIHVNAGWTGRITQELAQVGRAVTPTISIGSWEGLHLREYRLRVEAEMDEATGGSDDWKTWVVKRYTWEVEATKWEATDSFAVFLQLLLAQAQAPYPTVSVTTGFGSGTAYLSNPSFTRGDEPASETVTCLGNGALTSSDSFISLIITAVEDSLEQGYASPVDFTVPECGTGHHSHCYVRRIEVTVPSQDKVTRTIELQGDGPWSGFTT
jgi:hypothetical protein